MKKETAIKKLSTKHSDILECIQKLRDIVFSIDDDELNEDIEAWTSDFEAYLDGDGSITWLIEKIEHVLE